MGIAQTIKTARLTIDRADHRHAEALSAYYHRNADHLAPWEPLRPDGYHDIDQWRARLSDWQREANAGLALRFVASTRTKPDSVAAFSALTNISRGVFQACNLGYSLDARHEGHGYMTEMVAAIVDYAFTDLDLHRVMANYMPENARSAAVLSRLGFEQEGIAKRYLKIAGVWRDHVLTARVRAGG